MQEITFPWTWWTHVHSFPACSSPHLELASAIPLLLRSISWEADSERGSSPQVGERNYSVFLSSKPTHVTSRVKKESKVKCYILKLFQPLFHCTQRKKKPTTLFLLIIALANGYIFYEKNLKWEACKPLWVLGSLLFPFLRLSQTQIPLGKWLLPDCTVVSLCLMPRVDIWAR